ncbi:MAG: lysophospholipid acyltransferase family protein [Chthoniobacterales bacterium]
MNWKTFRYRCEYAALLGAARLVPLLPRIAVVFLAQVAGAIASVVDGRGRRVVLANLDCAFGKKYSPAEKRRILRQSYRHFAQTMFDLLWSPCLNERNFRRYVELENYPTTPDESAIIACFHYSNFEWLSLGCGFGGRSATILAQEFKNPLLDPVFRRLREQSGHVFTARTGGILRLYKTLRRGGNTALLVDLTIPPSEEAVAIECFGMQTSVTAAHAWLHQRTGGALIPAYCEPLARGRYRIVFHPRLELPPDATMRQVAQACWDSFEPVVRNNPAPWLWMYKHWRYQPAKADRPYPFYASVRPRFDRMIAGS